MISKTVRRMLAVSLAAVMAVGAMAGCGAKDDQGTPDPTKAPDKVDEGTKTDDTKEPEAEATATPTPIPEAYVIRTDANGNTVDLGGIEVIIHPAEQNCYPAERIYPDYTEKHRGCFPGLHQLYYFYR